MRLYAGYIASKKDEHLPPRFVKDMDILSRSGKSVHFTDIIGLGPFYRASSTKQYAKAVAVSEYLVKLASSGTKIKNDSTPFISSFEHDSTLVYRPTASYYHQLRPEEKSFLDCRKLIARNVNWKSASLSRPTHGSLIGLINKVAYEKLDEGNDAQIAFVSIGNKIYDTFGRPDGSAGVMNNVADKTFLQGLRLLLKDCPECNIVAPGTLTSPLVDSLYSYGRTLWDKPKFLAA